MAVAVFFALVLNACKKQDDAKAGNSSSANTAGASETENALLIPGDQFNPDIKYLSFTDLRDKQTYHMVKIGDLTWMAQNLNFKTDSSSCYNNEDSNCTFYGRLYDWDIAMKVCPDGWHLPHHRDWENLAVAVGGKYAYSSNEYGDYVTYSWEGSGRKLKSKIGWKDGSGNSAGNGTDAFGFSALPDGREISVIGSYGKWWTSFGYYDEPNDAWLARSLGMSWDNDDLYWGEHGEYKSTELSVRCVKGDAKAAYLSALSRVGEEAWENELNQIYGLLQVKLGKSDFSKLRDEQNAWTIERDLKADTEAKNACVSADEEDLQDLNHCTSYPEVYQSSLQEASRARTLELVDMYFDDN